MKAIITIILSITLLTLLASCSAAGGSTTALTDVQLEEQAREFVTQLAAGQFKEAREDFDMTMNLALSQQKLEETWAALQEQAGPFEKQGDVRIETEAPYKIVFVTCRFGMGALDVRVVFDQKGKISGLFFQPASDSSAMAPDYVTPEYADVTLFQEEDATIGSGEWQLPGTLTLPTGAGPFPAVVLVHGSGPNDRDETIGPNRVFKDLAWGLASRGIAVLRYEKRTREYGERFTGEILNNLTLKGEVIDDALAAITWLQARPEIDPSQIYVIGHSLGATVAPRIAAQNIKIAGLVLLAGATRPIEDLMLEQSTYLANADGAIDKDEDKALKDLQKMVDQVKQLPDQEKIDPAEIILGAGPAYWLDLMAYNPVATAESLTIPMLILQGERDYQVTMTDFAAWQAALSGRQNVTLKTYPALNHLFIAGQGPSLPEEYQIMGHVDATVINDIVGWIQP
ncbi:MAG TPA: alpha/beta fold hydrolase [Bellilinea sp.]|nr:alpha/beta fold hydrolase [Bellilinea sp.]